jgi:mannose-6-phosphate isomerase-like protein (cupin superfamily)
LSQAAAHPDPREGIFVDKRPWGQFEQFTLNETSTVKILTVAPDERLSLQRHEQRDELWCVLDGAVEVTVDESTWLAQPGEKIYIPRRSLHRAKGAHAADSRILEVAFGQFLESDIERLHDEYDRS